MQATRRISAKLALVMALFVVLAAPGGISPPSNQSPPTVTGIAQVGQTLTCSEGGWNGTQPITYTFQWRRNGAAIAGAIASTYVLTPEDAGTQIVCAVTASNDAGSASASSSAVIPVGLSAPTPEPADAIPPTVTGFSITPRKFRILYRTCKNNKATKIPTVKFDYTLSENANVKITTRYAGSDVKKAHPGNHDGTMAIAGSAGDNETKFGKELHGRYVLLVGKYTASIVATDAAGNQSNVTKLTFRVLLSERGDGKSCIIGTPGKQPKLKIP